jgi:hypothetical protein
MQYAIPLSAALAVALTLTSSPATADVIGSVNQKEYLGALGILTTGQEEALEYGVKVHAYETVVTGPSATTVLLFRDTSALQVGTNARVVLDRFVYDPTPGEGGALVKLGRGAFRFITGYTKHEDNLTIQTPTLSMVVRGTHLLIFVLANGMTEVNVIDGEVDAHPCHALDPLPLVTQQAALVEPDCSVTVGVARPAPPRTVVPTMPVDLALLDLEPAAGPDAASLDELSDDAAPRTGCEFCGGSRSASAGAAAGDPGGDDPGGDGPNGAPGGAFNPPGQGGASPGGANPTPGHGGTPPGQQDK